MNETNLILLRGVIFLMSDERKESNLLRKNCDLVKHKFSCESFLIHGERLL